MDNCKNCTTTITGKYCANCGQPAQLKRIDAHYIVHEIEHVLHFERGILYTMRELLLQPGKNIREYLSDNRSRLVKPILFIIVTSLIYSFINHYFHIEEAYTAQLSLRKSAVTTMTDWVQKHYGYANIIMGVFIALWVKLFFRKYQYNLFEILVMLCFVIGMGMLMFSVSALIEGLTQIPLFLYVSVVITGYCAWAIGQFFDKTKPANFIKALIAYLLGSITFWILLMILGIVIDLIFRK
ncbi:DUF3667 domain-containing protein [Flavobacterium sp.]|uniref:DUF3667 domain-containing protein n=1 Tax=Flavobacterium sp. TaxID=239 RepID=UPI00262F5708|nr:DUF3667 domain-containing protein [Flavobacterium sp.]